MPRPPKLFFTNRTELTRLLPRLKAVNGEPKRTRGRPYDAEDLERCARWNADRGSGKKWSQIAKERLPGVPAAVERIKQGVRRYRAFCNKQGITSETVLRPGAVLDWADQWEKTAVPVDLVMESIKSNVKKGKSS